MPSSSTEVTRTERLAAPALWYDTVVPTPVPGENILLDRRFQLGKVLGRGPSGVVYAATDRETEKPCAVKRLHPHYYDKDVLEQVERDAKAAADIKHPNILAVQHTGYETSGALYLVAPLVPGETLAQRLLRGPLSLTATLLVIEPLCAALQAALDAGLCHGAVTPNNILFPTAGGLLLTDFGVCNLRATPKVLWGGAMGYAAPETFAEGADLSTSRGDVFSVGAIVFECLTGQRMFSATSAQTFLSSVKTPPHLGSLLPQYEHLDAVLEMAATLNPEDRFSTAGALWRALKSSLVELQERLERDGDAGKPARKPPAPPAAPARLNAPRAPVERAARPVQQLPVVPLPMPELPPSLTPVAGLGASPNPRQPDPLPPPPTAGASHGALKPLPGELAPAAASRRPLPADPQRIIATDPAFHLRQRRRAEILQPLVWASLGGVVVAAAFLLLQLFHGSRPSGSGTALLTNDFEEASLLGRAQRDFAQRNYASALSNAELVLRTQPQHPQARAIVEQAADLLRASAVYGAFLRAADREDAEAAGALYRELPVGSPFRAQAWEPFMHVRNLFIQRRLALAQAALASGACDDIREQLDRLHWIADSEVDPALQQVQRLLGKCRSGVPTTVATAERPAEPEARHASERPAASSGASASGLHDPFKSSGGSDEGGDKPRRRRHKAKTGGEGGGDEKPEAKPEAEPEKSNDLPKALRNPF